MEDVAIDGTGTETDDPVSASSKAAGDAANEFFSTPECLAALARQVVEDGLLADCISPGSIGALARLCRVNRTCVHLFRNSLYRVLSLC